MLVEYFFQNPGDWIAVQLAIQSGDLARFQVLAKHPIHLKSRPSIHLYLVEGEQQFQSIIKFDSYFDFIFGLLGSVQFQLLINCQP